MNEIKNSRLLDAYIKKYGIDQIFSDFSYYYPYMTLVEFPRRSFICCDARFAGYFYFIVKGRYKVYGNLENGKRILYRFCNAFSVLGEMEFMLEERLRADINTVETVETCVAVIFDYREVVPRLLQDAKFLYFVCQIFAEKLSYFGNMQMVNSLSSAQEKVAIYLVNSTDKSGIFCENQGIVAEQLDISYRHLHRILRRFVENGWIARLENGYRILRPDKLRGLESRTGE